ncbi:waprin-like protein [Ylistrum balloti]|uniref:waprin-like protein n=1 Tax=Ylistrum balloti TaxID=509963 RepID=UPI002905A948|nr:waprin-like protein [Ylistrum balloti]
MTNMAMCNIWLLLVSLTVLTVSMQFVSGSSECPTQNPNVVWGCAYQPHCFSDSGCGSGHKCCPHTCGAFCYDTSTATHVTSAPDGDCHSLSCLLGEIIGRKK